MTVALEGCVRSNASEALEHFLNQKAAKVAEEISCKVEVLFAGWRRHDSAILCRLLREHLRLGMLLSTFKSWCAHWLCVAASAMIRII